MRTLLRLGTVLTVFLGVSIVQLPISQAIEVPETLADNRPVGAGPVETEFPIDYLGVLWDTNGAPDEHADEEAGEHGAVRFRVDGAWTAWQPLTEDGAQADGQWGSALVSADDAEAYQVRGVPADAIAPRAVAINTTDGPLVEVGRRPAGTANAVDKCVSRAEWGANEDLRFDATGEVWPTEFHPAQTMTVHHTATTNGADPVATMQAIYRYHTVDKGWGDIGYHYLIDEAGFVYEGRWSGAAPRTGSTSCVAGGDGSDFAHDEDNRLVTAGHTGGYNSGNMGAALLGDFTTHPKNGAEPAAAAVDALTSLLAEFATRHHLDPEAVVDYVNPADPTAKKTVNMISGHRDWTSTECPGERLYDDLPAIRDAVKAQMTMVSVSVTSPAGGDVVRDTVRLVATASSGVTSVDFRVDGTSIGTGTSGTEGWTFAWDTTSAAEGARTVTAVATKDGSTVTSSPVSVTVDNVSDPLVRITAPGADEIVARTTTVTAAPSDGVVAVDFRLDGVSIGTDAYGADGWSASWDTTSASEGSHELTAVAVDTAKQEASQTITVTVDNVSVTGLIPGSLPQNTTETVTIYGTGFRDGATVDLENGEGTEPQVSNVVFHDDKRITATFTTGKTNGPRKDRPWDVVVTNPTPEGSSAVRVDGFTVLR